MTKHLYWTLVLLFLLLGCSPPGSSMSPASEKSSSPAAQVLPIGAVAIIGTARIELEVAQTPQQQELGLMFRDHLPDNRGMLFPFDPPRPVSFWMKNVTIPLDMVFLRNGRVLAIAANVPPCTSNPCNSYGPTGAIDQVIELSGGRAKQLGLKVGDRIDIQWNR